MKNNSKIIECDVNELNNHLQNGGQNLIDVREYAEFSAGRVKGAKLIPLGDIEKRFTEIDGGKTIYLMCRSGKRSAEAQKRLLALGFSDVRNVRGGFESWRSAGFDFEKDTESVWSLDRQVRFTAGLLVVLGMILSWLLHPYFIGLSAFVGLGLIFSAVTDTCTMGLILLKMPWNQVNRAVGETTTQKA